MCSDFSLNTPYIILYYGDYIIIRLSDSERSGGDIYDAELGVIIDNKKQSRAFHSQLLLPLLLLLLLLLLHVIFFLLLLPVFLRGKYFFMYVLT